MNMQFWSGDYLSQGANCTVIRVEVLIRDRGYADGGHI
jgi:hypothetical protein